MSTNNDSSEEITEELSNLNISSNRDSNRNCLFCLKRVKGSMRCSQCRTALYCNRECQTKHWPVHRNLCQDSNDTENSNEKLRLKAENNYSQGNKIIYYKSFTNNHY